MLLPRWVLEYWLGCGSNPVVLSPQHLEETADDLNGLPFKLHDFGFRGVSSVEVCNPLIQYYRLGKLSVLKKFFVRLCFYEIETLKFSFLKPISGLHYYNHCIICSYVLVC